MAKENIKTQYERMLPNSVIAIDCSWDHVCNGGNCILVAIDQTTKKIIDFVHLIKSSKGNKSYYHGSSNNMEKECCKYLICSLNDDPRIIGYCHDNNLTISKLFRENWGIEDYLDPNHTLKSFVRLFNKANSECGNLLTDLLPHLTSFLKLLIRLNLLVPIKRALWYNTVNHFRGIHVYCSPHKQSKFYWINQQNQLTVNALLNFLKDSIYIVEKCQKPYSTQLSEYYNSLKSHYLSKEKGWCKSVLCRLCISLLEFNQMFNWENTLRERLQ